MERAELAARLREKGIRPSEQRLAVYAWLLDHRVHPNADMIYQGLAKTHPTLSRTTVYNTLKLLAAAGLIRTVPAEDLQIRYDGNPEFHAHFHCRRCGELFDVPAELPIPRMPRSFSLLETRIDYSGYCPACRETP